MTPQCPSCGGSEFEEGFIETLGQNGVRWMSGPLKLNIFGTAKKSKLARHPILARACTTCDRLELYRAPSTY